MSSNPSTRPRPSPAPSSSRLPAGSARAAADAALGTAPALLLVGVLLMLVPDTWTLSHLVFLAGTLAMLPTAAILHELLTRVGARRARWPGTALTVVGALALAGQFVIDLVVLQLAGGEDAVAGRMFDQLQASPAFALVFFIVGPALLFTGLALSGAVLLARSHLRHGPAWLLVAGSLLMGLARLVEVRPLEVIALGLITVALAAVRPAHAHRLGPTHTS